MEVDPASGTFLSIRRVSRLVPEKSPVEAASA